jgi:VWFA-related protein
MRRLAACGTIVCALATAGHAAQNQRPVFRSGVDLIAVDVAVLDSRGRPVEDLRAGDFVVKVDGRPRPVLSADLVRFFESQTTPAAVPRSGEALVSTNAVLPNARRVIVAVDQTEIRPGTIAPLLAAASKFLDRLTPQDHVAFVTFPEPGPQVDFTTDRSRVRAAMQGVIGQPALNRPESQTLSLGLWEAINLNGRARTIEVTAAGEPGSNTIQDVTLRTVLERGCMGLTIEELLSVEYNVELLQCKREALNQAYEVFNHARAKTNISLRGLESILKQLALVEGPKSLFLVSAALLNDDPIALEPILRLAAAARVSIHVIAVEPPDDGVVVREQLGGQPPSALLDRSIQIEGLDALAAGSRGSLIRAAGGNFEGIFDRLAVEISAAYVLAVARQAGDAERQRVDVEVKRKGVTVRASRTVVAADVANAKRPMEEVLRDALSSPFAIPGLPLRVSTFAQRDTSTGKYLLHVAAHVGQPGAPAADFATGIVVMDTAGGVVTTAGRQQQLAPLATSGNEPLHFDTVVPLDPGTYLLRIGVVDVERRRGTVVRSVELPAVAAGELGTSDLIVGNLPPDGEPIHPSVEPQINAGELAGYLELYPGDGDGDRDRVSVSLEVAEGESSPALATQTLRIRDGDAPGTRVAMGVVTVAAAPGRYLARAVVRRDGAIVRSLFRPFVIVRADRAVIPTARRGAEMPAAMRQRTAAYVAGVVAGLSNIVAQEDFVLSDPDRRVTSDLLLVRYPGSNQDLMSYRDVWRVNGNDLTGRADRLADLFLVPPADVRTRARQISLDGEEFVPAMFNPVFVLAFLQADFQPRFELTVKDAGAEWPSEVRAVTFVETRRPTLLRAGLFGDQNVPASGTAWIEEGTGRILQTELSLGRGRAAIHVLTRFRLDERLQIMVPATMRTQNPSGAATYSNFRRFNVQTDSVIPQREP